MTFKEFDKWCNERAADGRWGFNEFAYCAAVINYVHQIHPWFNKEKKYEARWNSIPDDKCLVEEIVKKTNEKN